MHDCQLLFFPWYTSNNFSSFFSIFYRSHRTFMSQHDSHCFAQYFHIKFQAPVRNITAIKCYHLFKIRNLTAPAYLPHPGDPRFDCQAASMVQLIFHPLIFRWWSCTYQRHIPFEHVPELWKLIDGPVTDLISKPLFYRPVRQTPAAMMRGSKSSLNIIPSDTRFSAASAALRSSASRYILRNL